MSVEFITKNYPANDVTDGQFLYRSLGSFWTYIFSDKNLLKGYTTGMAEELIQAYYTLTEVINQYSVKDVPILHKEKWYPLKIKKSEFNKTKFIFEPGGAVFGALQVGHHAQAEPARGVARGHFAHAARLVAPDHHRQCVLQRA